MAYPMKPKTPLACLLWEADLCRAVAADLNAGTWTFKIPQDVGAKSGSFAIVPAQEVREAIRQEQDLVVLEPADGLAWRAYHGGDFAVLEGVADDGLAGVTMQCEVLPSAYARAHGEWKPGIWYGSEQRIDSDGRRWKRQLGHHVMDDFGFLVEVPR